METVEQLMIGEETEMQFVVDKALVQSLVYWGERYILSFILEYVGNALCLFFAVAQYIQFISVLQQRGERFADKVEIFVINRLRRTVERQGGAGFVAE